MRRRECAAPAFPTIPFARTRPPPHHGVRLPWSGPDRPGLRGQPGRRAWHDGVRQCRGPCCPRPVTGSAPVRAGRGLSSRLGRCRRTAKGSRRRGSASGGALTVVGCPSCRLRSAHRRPGLDAGRHPEPVRDIPAVFAVGGRRRGHRRYSLGSGDAPADREGGRERDQRAANREHRVADGHDGRRADSSLEASQNHDEEHGRDEHHGRCADEERLEPGYHAGLGVRCSGPVVTAGVGPCGCVFGRGECHSGASLSCWTRHVQRWPPEWAPAIADWYCTEVQATAPDWPDAPLGPGEGVDREGVWAARSPLWRVGR